MGTQERSPRLRYKTLSKIQEGAATAAVVGLSKTIDAFYEAEAGMRVGNAAQIVRAYSHQIAAIAKNIDRRAALNTLPPAPPTQAPPEPPMPRAVKS